MAAQLAHLDAAVGVAQAASIAILAALCVLPTTMKANQVSRFAGLYVRLRRSGTSINQPATLAAHERHVVGSGPQAFKRPEF